MREEDVWFEPKRYGYGAGLPVAWQGWVLIGGFMVVVLLLSLALGERHPILLVVVTLILTAGLLPICARHTRGGWRWRTDGDG